MHEMGIALQIVRIATEAIPDEAKNIPIKKVNIQVGKLTAVVPESLRFCFEVAIKDTPLKGAELSIEELPIRGRCPKCQSEWTITDPEFMCKKCEDGDIDIISGQELHVTSIEISDKKNRD